MESVQRAQLTCDYLHTNSTTHEFLFGALAELVDNARDASSKRIDIYSEPTSAEFRGKFMLCFLDDGDGMDRDEVANVIQFGRSIKRKVDQHMIGQYGNGLKSGTMRIANDMILFSKKNNTLSCLFISRTFYMKEKIEAVVVPMPCWNGATKEALPRDPFNPGQHDFEVNLIAKYSPFKTEQEILAQFDKIGTTGSLVIVYNMKTMDNGEPELDIISDPHDIKMADPYKGETYGDDNAIVPERKSFRAYTAVLYIDPKMKIYIQHKKVHTIRIFTSLFKPKMYHFTSTRFKRRSEKEAENAVTEYKIANEEAREAEQQDRELREKAENAKVSLADLRIASQKATEKRTAANMKKKIADMKNKSMKEPKTLNFIYGVNLERRKCDGVMLYNCGRLIKMYEKVGCQVEGGMKGYGVLGVVDVPYLVLEPTHNKQDFADHKEFKSMTRALGEHLDHYWKECIANQKRGVTQFWETYGYVSNNWKDDPSNEPKYLRKRAMDLHLYAQCDKCLKWREVPFHSSNVGKELPDNWCCMDNPNPECKKCHLPEKKISIPKAVLKKETKSTEEKRQVLEEEVRKTQEKLSRLEPKTKPQPSTSRNTEAPVRSSQPAAAQRAPSPPRKRQQVVLPKSVPTPPPARTSSTPTRTPSQARASPASTKPAQASKSAPTKQASTTVERTPIKVAPPVPKDKAPVNLKRIHAAATVKQESQSTAKRKKAETLPEPEVTRESVMEWSSDGEPQVARPVATATQKTLDIATLHGRLCEGKTENKEWHMARITAVKQKEGVTRVKVKYRDHPKDKFDKWYDYPSPEINILEEKDKQQSSQKTAPPQTVIPAVTSPRSLPSSPPVELPSTTTTVEAAAAAFSYASPEQSSPVRSPDTNVSSVADREEMIQQVAESLRTCLAFFAPPDYSVSRDQIKVLPLEELRRFPVQRFCDEYEKGLSKLINEFVKKKDEAEEKSKEMERSRDENRTKLLALRQSAMKLLRSLETVPDLDPTSDDVDQMLDAIAKEAETENQQAAIEEEKS